MPSPSVAPRSPSQIGAPRVVGLGASAGGLQALEGFLANVPPDSGMAYVVVQHLDPTHRAALTELLARISAIPVRQAIDGMAVCADTVYVIAPNSELTVWGGRLHASAPTLPHGARRPIDTMFDSLALAQGHAAIGVVLSGMGSDGTRGLQSIRSRGGMTYAQTPESAAFDSMPRSAISACAELPEVERNSTPPTFFIASTTLAAPDAAMSRAVMIETFCGISAAARPARRRSHHLTSFSLRAAAPLPPRQPSLREIVRNYFSQDG